MENAHDSDNAVERIETFEEVDLETTTKVNAPIPRFTATLQTHAGSANAPMMEETMEETMSVFASNVGSHIMSKLNA